jgi:hypothetical protein
MNDCFRILWIEDDKMHSGIGTKCCGMYGLVGRRYMWYR